MSLTRRDLRDLGRLGNHSPSSGSLRSRVGFGFAVVVLTWIGEEFPTIEPHPWWYQRSVAGLPLHYLLFAALLLLIAPALVRKPPFPISRALHDTRLWVWSVLGGATVALTVGLGLVRGASEFFIDWRNFAVLAVVVVAAARWLAAQSWRRWALTDIAIAYGVMSSLGLVTWILGSGTTFFGVRVPIYYGYNLMLAGFAAIVASDAWLNDKEEIGDRRYVNALGWTALTSSLVVILSFRRSFWLLLLAGLAIVAWRAWRAGRLRGPVWVNLVISGSLAVGLAFAAFGSEALVDRIVSVNPLSSNSLAITNSDHLGDIADAMDVVIENPILGLGIGTYYDTTRILDWKTESFEVHNAFVNAWLKFGLLGVIVYIGFHVRWILTLLKSRGLGLLGGVGAGIYLIAEQVPSLIQTWPYSSFQISIHHGIVLAALLVAYRRSPARSAIANDLDAHVQAPDAAGA